MLDSQGFAVGRLCLPSRLFLAPMAGVTDLPFRLLCREAGAGLTTTEMISDLALLGRSRRSREIIQRSPVEGPVAAQLTGACPLTMARAAEVLASRGFALLDINMGCPAPKIVTNGEGAALMREPRRAAAIVAAVRSAVGDALPVTAKIRSGWDADSINAVDFARLLEQAGVAAVTVHGRVRAQFYGGKADWSVIRAVKQAVSVPVIGNGDVNSGRDAVAMLAETGCDGVMIGRAALGNPAIFCECAAALAGEEAVSRRAIGPAIPLRHLRMMLALKGERRGMIEMRKHAAWYLAGMPGAARLRDEVMRVERPAELVATLRAAFASGGHDSMQGLWPVG